MIGTMRRAFALGSAAAELRAAGYQVKVSRYWPHQIVGTLDVGRRHLTVLAGSVNAVIETRPGSRIAVRDERPGQMSAAASRGAALARELAGAS